MKLLKYILNIILIIISNNIINKYFKNQKIYFKIQTKKNNQIFIHIKIVSYLNIKICKKLMIN